MGLGYRLRFVADEIWNDDDALLWIEWLPCPLHRAVVYFCSLSISSSLTSLDKTSRSAFVVILVTLVLLDRFEPLIANSLSHLMCGCPGVASVLFRLAPLASLPSGGNMDAEMAVPRQLDFGYFRLASKGSKRR